MSHFSPAHGILLDMAVALPLSEGVPASQR